MKKPSPNGSRRPTTARHDGAHDVHLDLGDRSYDILIRPGVLDDLGPAICRATGHPDGGGRTAVVVTNPKVELYFGKQTVASLEGAGFRVVVVTFPAGESYKTLQTVRRLYRRLHAEQVDRRAVVVALGGGVIGDLAGFAAATYNRGLDFVQVPTTLLAQVDSSVGGKTGVNFDSGKNLIGAFYQPRLVVIDPDTLRTLPLRERRSGLAEIIKYGAIYDRPFYDLLKAEATGIIRLTSPHLDAAIARSCEIKARVVERDEHDDGLRAILNFGHTVGHALEAVTHYRVYRHGEAVAAGMISAALIGEKVGYTPAAATAELIALIESAGFSAHLPETVDIDDVMRLLAWDKKSVSGEARFVLIDGIGQATPGHRVPVDVIRDALLRQRTL